MMSNMCNLVLKEVAVCTRGLQTPSQQWGPRFFMRSGAPCCEGVCTPGCQPRCTNKFIQY